MHQPRESLPKQEATAARGAADDFVRRAVELAGRRWPAPRVWLLAAEHVAVFVTAYLLACGLRFDFHVPAHEWRLLEVVLPWVIAVKAGVFLAAGHYHGWWRYVTLADLVALVRAAFLSLLIFVVAGYFVAAIHIPRSIVILDFVLTVLLLGALRSSGRIFREHFRPALKPRNVRWALLVGTDETSGVLAHQIQSHGGLPYRIRGLLATDGRKTPGMLGQMRILGHIDDVGETAARHGATEVLVLAGSLPGNRLRRLMQTCTSAGLTLKIIPTLEDRFNGHSTVPVRDIDIHDLLRREPVVLDTRTVGELIEGRTILVTGAGGSIGSEICRQVIRLNPRRLVLVGRGENRLFFIERELQLQGRHAAVSTRIADVTDAARMRQVFEEHRPDIVFHAAAHKHVPLMEANPGEAIKTNVLGTVNVADLADEFDAQSFVLISTDKAVRPRSVMGATKLLAERYVMALAERSRTRFVATRFGNVLGSAGSVVPIFQEQIRRGGPITVTDPAMTRFFMSIPEACHLVLQSAALGKGGEIFVLDMGEPVRIVDLARDLIRLSGLSEHSIEIAFTGVRPGERLHEELYHRGEQLLETAHPKIRAAYYSPFSPIEGREIIDRLRSLVDRPPERIRESLHQTVSELLASPVQEDAAETPESLLPDPHAV